MDSVISALQSPNQGRPGSLTGGGRALETEERRKINAYWRAANYISGRNRFISMTIRC